MKKILTAVSAFALAGFVASTAQAKITELNIGGSIELTGIYADNTSDIKDTNVDGNNDQTAYYELNVDLDFVGKASENVEFAIKTEWNDLSDRGAANGSLELDEAYITLKEFGYKPLTVTAGLTNPVISLRGDDAAMTDIDMMGLTADLDFEPVQIKVFAGTLNETDNAIGSFEDAMDNDFASNNKAFATQSDDSVQGMILDWWFGENNLVTGSVMHFQEAADRAGSTKQVVNAKGEVVTVAVAGDNEKEADYFQYILGADWFFGQNIEAYGQIGMQDGDIDGNTDLDAFMLQIGAKYTFNSVDMKPFIDLGYKTLSGDDKNNNDNDDEAWRYNGDDDIAILLEDELEYSSNLEQFRLLTGISDVAGVKGLDLNFNFFYNQTEENYVDNKDGIGEEYDFVAKYAYSEDVNLYAAWAHIDVDSDLSKDADDMDLLKWGVVVNF